MPQSDSGRSAGTSGQHRTPFPDERVDDVRGPHFALVLRALEWVLPAPDEFARVAESVQIDRPWGRSSSAAIGEHDEAGLFKDRAVNVQ